jgi:hypothetical protein
MLHERIRLHQLDLLDDVRHIRAVELRVREGKPDFEIIPAGTGIVEVAISLSERPRNIQPDHDAVVLQEPQRYWSCRDIEYAQIVDV